LSQVNRARVKRVVISPDAFFHIMGSGTAWSVESGIPQGARLRGLTLDPTTQNLNLFVEHEEFEEVDVSREIAPQLEMLFKKL